MVDRLKGKVALVTGAGSSGPGVGNGKATATLFAREGAKVVCVDRVVERAAEAFGRLDILVNAVGGGAGAALHSAEQYPEQDWDWIIDLNLRSQFLVSKAAARAMIAGGRGGRILNISSVRGQLGLRAGYSAYVAAKGAMNALTRQYAVEWAPFGITVNAISPTFVRTPQVESMLADREFYEALVARIPLARIADPDDLVGAVLFFCSDASSFCTGQVLTLDGGLTATQ
jgi:gluconate 5-dehydrogenase